MAKILRKESKKVNIKEQSKKGSMSDHKKEFFKKLLGSVSEDSTDSSQWVEKQKITINQRLGIKKHTDFPYPGAPDIPLPETDKIIKQSVPTYVLSSWNSKKIALVKIANTVNPTPELKEKARKAEKGLNWVLRSRSTNWLKKLILSADNMKQYGHALFRTYEDFTSTIVHKVINVDDFTPEQLKMFKDLPMLEKKQELANRFELDLEDDAKVLSDIVKAFNSGDKTIGFDIERISSVPNVEIPIPTKVTVPTYTTDINSAERIKYQIEMTRHELEEEMDNGRFIKNDIDDIVTDGSANDSSGNGDTIEKEKLNNSDTTDNAADKDIFKINIVNTWYKPSKDSRYQRWVFVYLDGVSDPEKAILQDIPFGGDYEGWDFDKCDNETKDCRYYDSRGEGEMIRALQEVMDRSVSNMLIRDEFNNMPLWEVQDNSEIMDSNMPLSPGMKLPVQQLGQEINQLNQQPIPDTSSQQLMVNAKTFIEEYRNSNDRFFRNATNPAGDKTLGEVKAGIQQSTGPMSVDVLNWNSTLSNVYFKMFSILKERMDDSIFIDGEEITREDFNFPAEVISNGNIEVADKERAVAKAQSRVMMVSQMMQAGVADGTDLFNAYQDWLEKDGVNRVDDYSTDPEEIMQTKLAQMQQQLQQGAQQLEQIEDEIGKGQKAIGRNRAKIDKDNRVHEGETSFKITKGEDVKVTKSETKSV